MWWQVKKMKYQVRLYAMLKERAGASQVGIELDEFATAADLLERIFNLYPQFQPFAGRLLLSVNREFAEPALQLHAGDEIALFPPVSGG